MSPCTLPLVTLPKGDATRVHPFLNIAGQENSMGTLESSARLSNPSAQRLIACLDVIFNAYSNIHIVANSISCKWVNDVMEDIVKLLDMCNAASDKIAEVKRYEKLLQTAIHPLEHAGMDISKISQTPLSRVTNMLGECRGAIAIVNARCNPSTSRRRQSVNIEEFIGFSDNSRLSRSERDFSKDLCNLKDCAAYVLETVAKALSVELPRPFLHAQRDPRVTTGCCSRLRRLFERVRNHNSRCNASRCLLHELENVDVLVRKLHDILLAEKQQKRKKDPRDVKGLVQELKKCMVQLEGGIATLDSKVKELYSALIANRMTLLDLLTYSHC